MSFRFVPAVRQALAGSLLLVVFVGCSSPNTVAGTVTFEGEPLPAGKVSFLCEGGRKPSRSAEIGEGGRYRLTDLPAGRAVVRVQTFAPQPKPEPGVDSASGIDYSLGWKDPGPYVPIPKRYHSVSTSGLECLVTGGDQTFDIKLTK